MDRHPPSSDIKTDTRGGGRFQIFYGWVVVAFGTVLMATSFGLSYSFSVYFSFLQAEFSWGRAATSGVYSLYLLLVGFFSILCGRATDRWGPKPVVLIMGVISGVSLVLTARVQELWQLYITYSVLLSAGTGGVYIITMSTASRWFYRQRATAMGILGTGASLGAVVMAPVSAWMIQAFQWRTAYVLSGVLAWVLMIPAALALKRDAGEIGAGLDGDPIAPAGPHRDTETTAAFSIAGALKSPGFRDLALVWFWFSFGLYMVVTHIVPLARDVGLEPIRAAAAMSMLTAVSAVMRVIGGMVADRMDKRKLLSGLTAAMALSMVWLAATDRPWMVYAFALVFGLAFGGGDPSLISLVTEVFGIAKVGTMMGILMISWGLGSAAGPYFAGVVHDFTGSYGWAFIVAAAGFLLAAVSCRRLKFAPWKNPWEAENRQPATCPPESPAKERP